MTEPAVRLVEVSKNFRLRTTRRQSLKERAVRGRADAGEEFWALRNVTFDVPKGSCFGIVGHNGSGKSTALKVMAGIYRPTSGTAQINGRMSALLELGAGFHPELTGRENIVLNGAILGMSKSEVAAATDEIIEFAGLDDFIDAPVKVYSSGMYVRLGFAIAVAVRPEILVVDEVIAVGDEQFQRKCFDHFHELRRRGSTVILVSHGLATLSDLCDEAIWLDHGRVAMQDAATAVVRDYVTSVNAQDQVTGPDGLLRRGSGEAQITGMEIIDPVSGEPEAVLVVGQPGLIRLHMRVEQPVERAVVGMSLDRENGLKVAAPASSVAGMRSLQPGVWTVDFEIDELPLTPGTYDISTAVAADGAFLDYLERAFRLRVRGDGRFEAGLVRLDGRWEFTAQ